MHPLEKLFRKHFFNALRDCRNVVFECVPQLQLTRYVLLQVLKDHVSPLAVAFC